MVSWYGTNGCRASLIGAGMISVLTFPLLGLRLAGRETRVPVGDLEPLPSAEL